MPKLRDLEIIDQKNKVKINLGFRKDIVTFVGKILKHKDRIYEVAIGTDGHKLTIEDHEVDRVDPEDQDDTYRFYMETNQTLKAEDVKSSLMSRIIFPEFKPIGKKGGGIWEPVFNADLIEVKNVDFDAQYLTDEIASFVERGQKKYMKGDKGSVKPYIPLAYANVAYLMGKIYGEVWAAAMVNHPATDLLAYVWLNGYAMQSALKKSGVNVTSDLEAISDEKIEEIKGKYDEFVKKLAEHFQKDKPDQDQNTDLEEEDDDDQESP